MNTFLPGLGISDVSLAQNPTKEAFPKAFNQGCKRVWDAVVDKLNLEEDKDLNWGLAIKRYIESCIEQDLYPFSNLKQSTNDIIVNRLLIARRSVVKFFNNSRILDLTDVRATKREVKMTSTGFVLRVFGKATIKDPTFPARLLQMPYPGFRLKHEGQYLKGLGNGVTVAVRNEGANGIHRWHIGYEIVVNAYPEIPGHPVPSKAELEDFVLKILWPPIMKANRTHKYQVRPL